MGEEELAVLMSGDVDLDAIEVEESSKKEEKQKTDNDDGVPDFLAPEASEDNRMVAQLDDVTRDSEEKANEMFDSLDIINEYLGGVEEALNGNVKDIIGSNIEIFTNLSKQFPKVKTFQTSLDNNKILKEMSEKMLDDIYNNQDEIMMIMDKMQYQDIHRQKIERVINVMRSLSTYMNHLFSSSVDDSTRVSSAKHIPGDENHDTVEEDDIEALIASLGK